MARTKTRGRVRGAGSLSDVLEDRTGRLAQRFRRSARTDEPRKGGRRPLDGVMRIAPGHVVLVDRRK